MTMCTGCGDQFHALKVACWQDMSGGGSWADTPSVPCFGLICQDCRLVLEHRESIGAVHSLMFSAVSPTAGEIVAAWIGDVSRLDRIADALNGKEWGSDTCEIIAGIVRASGRVVGDVEGVQA